MDGSVARIMTRRVRPVLAHGFTLIELLVTVTILAVLGMIATPSFNEAILSNRLTSFANNFVASALLARSEAVKRNSVVRVCRSSDGASCATSGSWEQGWIVFADPNNNGTVDSGETVIQVQQALTSGYLFKGDAYTLAFPATGAGASTATLTLCRALPTVGSQERSVLVRTSGRVSVSTTKNAACS